MITYFTMRDGASLARRTPTAFIPTRPASTTKEERVEPTQEEKAADFRELHEGEPFIIPNPWDAGSARVLQALGFRALATTSSGFAFTLGRLDGGAGPDEVMEHVRMLARSSTLPVSVDLENGYGPDPKDAGSAITRAAEAGAVGGSIEDYDPGGEIYGREHASERVAAASEAAGRLGFGFTLTARAENHIRGTRTSMTPSSDCRPTSGPAPTFCMPPDSVTGTRSERLRRPLRSLSTCWRIRACRWGRSSTRAVSGSASEAR